MSLIRPFRALRPAPGRAAEVLAPPYDVMSEAEARAMVAGRPWSFLHISRAEVDLPLGTDPHHPTVYAQARATLDRLRREGILVSDALPSFSLYRLSLGDHQQTGLVAAASVRAYVEGRIRRHELTRPEKEDDRVRQIEALSAQTGPVFLLHRASERIAALLAHCAQGAPEIDVTAPDGVRHQLWPLRFPELLEELGAAYESLDALYIADGHHRAAAAARVSKSLGRGDRGFLAVLFPHDQPRVLDYNRLVRELGALDRATFLARLAELGKLAPEPGAARPAALGEFGLYLPGQWYRLRLDAARIPADDPVGRLDASLLQGLVLGPLLGIEDPRRDRRIDFVGGSRGLEALAARVDSGEMAAAFALHPTSAEALMAVADAGALMPPKSTWFEPKLADGLVSLVLD
ncbi:MAG: DUF1015 domain-containing protein [Chromatiaceae bacterium]|nr:DUF1015 domain-containing protein [Chromatiaceae bacterium]